MGRKLFDGLMVRAIYDGAAGTAQFSQFCARDNANLVLFLRWRTMRGVQRRQVRNERSAVKHVQQLRSAADSKQRQGMPVKGLEDSPFRRVPIRVCAANCGGVGTAIPRRLNILAAGEANAVELLDDMGPCRPSGTREPIQRDRNTERLGALPQRSFIRLVFRLIAMPT